MVPAPARTSRPKPINTISNRFDPLSEVLVDGVDTKFAGAVETFVELTTSIRPVAVFCNTTKSLAPALTGMRTLEAPLFTTTDSPPTETVNTSPITPSRANRSSTHLLEHTMVVTADGVDVLTAGPGAVSPCAPWNR